MNKVEARQLLALVLREYEETPYEKLATRIGETLAYEKPAPSGKSYQLEVLFLWDSEPDQVIRVIGSIDDGGWRAFCPLTDSILKNPPG